MPKVVEEGGSLSNCKEQWRKRMRVGDNDVHDVTEPENFFLSHPLADSSNAFFLEACLVAWSPAV